VFERGIVVSALNIRLFLKNGRRGNILLLVGTQLWNGKCLIKYYAINNQGR
jgi:hypothetical protein